MKFNVRCQGFRLTQGLQSRVVRSFEWVPRCFSGSVRSVRVSLCDVNGPRGGRDKRCLVELSLPRRQRLVITEVQADMYAAIDCAAGRAHRLMGRVIVVSRPSAAAMRERERVGKEPL